MSPRRKKGRGGGGGKTQAPHPAGSSSSSFSKRKHSDISMDFLSDPRKPKPKQKTRSTRGSLDTFLSHSESPGKLLPAKRSKETQLSSRMEEKGTHSTTEQAEKLTSCSPKNRNKQMCLRTVWQCDKRENIVLSLVPDLAVKRDPEATTILKENANLTNELRQSKSIAQHQHGNSASLTLDLNCSVGSDDHLNDFLKEERTNAADKLSGNGKGFQFSGQVSEKLEGRVSRIASRLLNLRPMLHVSTFSVISDVLSELESKVSILEQVLKPAFQPEVTSLGNFVLQANLECQTSNTDERSARSTQGFKDKNMNMHSSSPASSAVEVMKAGVVDLNKLDCKASATSQSSSQLPNIGSSKQSRSLQERVNESRAVLHSKLNETVPKMTNICLQNAGSKFICNPISPKHAFSDGIRNVSEDIEVVDEDFETNPTLQNHKGQTTVQENSFSVQAYSSEDNSTQQFQIENTSDFLECEEDLQLDDQENVSEDEALNDCVTNELHFIGDRVATAGWYACNGDAIILAHDDGCCSFYDVANMEEKAVYSCPAAIPWDDCWLIKTFGSDGTANKYIVAATSGSAMDAGFCSWDFYNRTVVGYHNEVGHSSVSGRQSVAETLQSNIRDPPCWWYRPCGPLIASTASFLKDVTLYDIRDGDAVMKWVTERSVVSLDYCSPLQWRTKGKLALVEDQAITVWDVHTNNAKCLQSIPLPGKQISAFHVNCSDAESSGGVRHRLNSSDMEGYDSICCTESSISVLDFRAPKGLGIRFPTMGQDIQSVYAKGDMVLTGGVNPTYNECGMQMWSLRKGKAICTYQFPPLASHYAQLSLTQVWATSSATMAVNGNGLHVFGEHKYNVSGHVEEVKTVLGSQDLYNPSFDYACSRILLVSKDRPASWCYWPQ